jgi:hypothetical protein
MAEFAAPLADGIGNLGLDMDSYVEEDWGDLEPLFFDEAVAVAEHAAAEEKRRQKEEEEAREVERRKLKFQAYMAARDRIREFDPKLNRFCFTRFYMVDLSEFDLDEECELYSFSVNSATLLPDRITILFPTLSNYPTSY